MGYTRQGFLCSASVVTEQLDTSTPGARVLFSIMGALSEFERDLIVERTVAGIQAAKARGVTVGRPRSMSHEQVKHAKTLVEGGEPKRKVARLFKVSAATLYRALAA